MNYYLGPWVWDTSKREPFWRSPDDAVGLVDLRPTPACVATVSHERNFGFFAVDGELAAPYLLLGDSLDAPVEADIREKWASTLGISTPDSRTVLDLLWDLLTLAADPSGTLLTFPLMPTSRGELELYLGGHSLVRSRHFEGASDPAWPKIRDLLQGIYRRRRDDGGRLHRRLLSIWREKYKIEDLRQFIPSDLPLEQPLRPETSYSDDFNRANSDSLGGSWTEVTGDFDIVSNHVENGGVDASWARYDEDLSSDDHECQVESADNYLESQFGVSVRCSPTAYTCYNTWAYWVDGDPTAYITKVVAGTPTVLASEAGGTGTFPISIWGEADGSTISVEVGLDDASTIVKDVTDTAITGNVRCGICCGGADAAGYVTLDNWLCEDLAGGAVVYPWWYYEMIGRY